MGRAAAARARLRYGRPQRLRRRPTTTLLPRPAAGLVHERGQRKHAGEDQPGLAAPAFPRARRCQWEFCRRPPALELPDGPLPLPHAAPVVRHGLMARWSEFASAEPALARRVEERFRVRKHKTLATLRKDGSPRISGIEVEFADGELYLGMMPGSLKLRDLERDPRLALHGPAEDALEEHPPGWAGAAKLAGYAL